MYGTLDVVATLKCHEVLPDVVDPTGRYVGWRNGLKVTVLDTAPDVPVSGATFRDATSTERYTAIHPNGRHLVVRDRFNQALTLMTGPKTRRTIMTETTLTGWDGEVLAPRTRTPRWSYGAEFVGFDATGDYILLATHQPDGQACVQLYATADLSLVDTLTDLRLYSGYAVPSGEAFVPMRRWTSESAFIQDQLEPGRLLAIRNAGDSCMGVFAIQVEDGRLTQADPETFSKGVFKVDDYWLRALRLLHGGGMLVVDRDMHLGRIAWPPKAPARRLAHRFALSQLHDGESLPGYSGDPWDLDAVEALTITPDHILLNVNQGPRTLAMAAIHPTTLAPLGWVMRPKDRLRFGAIVPLGGDLFAGVGSNTTRLWRLRR